MNSISKVLAGFTALGVALFLLFIGPAFTVMALQTLFLPELELTSGTWFAAFWLHCLLYVKVNGGKE